MHAMIAFFRRREQKNLISFGFFPLDRRDSQEPATMTGLPSDRPIEVAINKDNNDLQENFEAAASASIMIAAQQPDTLAEAQLQVVSYIEEISLELRDMARAVRLDSLAYFIDMTRFEAAAHRRARERRLVDAAAAR
jgi:hypothetical protein